jgi:outer membrane lipase/esterase
MACGVNQIAVKAGADSSTSPSSLYCSTPNSAISNAGTLRAAKADTTFVFADSVHPTTAAHAALADYLAAKLPWLLAESFAKK